MGRKFGPYNVIYSREWALVYKSEAQHSRTSSRNGKTIDWNFLFDHQLRAGSSRADHNPYRLPDGCGISLLASLLESGLACSIYLAS